MAADIVPGGQYSSSNPYGLAVFRDKLYFSADDGYTPSLGTLDQKVFALAVEPQPVPLRFPAPKVSTGKELTLTLSLADGVPVTSNQLAKIQIYTSVKLSGSLEQWQLLTEPLKLVDGSIQVDGLTVTNAPRRFFQAVQTP